MTPDEPSSQANFGLNWKSYIYEGIPDDGEIQ